MYVEATNRYLLTVHYTTTITTGHASKSPIDISNRALKSPDDPIYRALKSLVSIFFITLFILRSSLDIKYLKYSTISI